MSGDQSDEPPGHATGKRGEQGQPRRKRQQPGGEHRADDPGERPGDKAIVLEEVRRQRQGYENPEEDPDEQSLHGESACEKSPIHERA